MTFLFKNGPSKVCGRQPLKKLTWSILEYLDPHVLIIFIIYLIDSFSNKYKHQPTKYHKCFQYTSEDKKVLSFIFDSYFDL